LDVVVQALEVNWPAGQLVQGVQVSALDVVVYVGGSCPWISSSPKFKVVSTPKSCLTVQPK
jgi:hypothetical protein